MLKYQSQTVVMAGEIVAAEFRQDGSGKLYTANPGQPNSRTLWIVPPGFKLPNSLPGMDVDGGDWFILYNDGRMTWLPKADFEQQFSQVVEDEEGGHHNGDTSVEWKETARRHASNEAYYRNIVIEIGELLGDEAKTTDTGAIRAEVLRAKVYEVAKKRLGAQRQLDPYALASAVAETVVGASYISGKAPDTAEVRRRVDKVREAALVALAEQGYPAAET